MLHYTEQKENVKSTQKQLHDILHDITNREYPIWEKKDCYQDY